MPLNTRTITCIAATILAIACFSSLAGAQESSKPISIGKPPPVFGEVIAHGKPENKIVKLLPSRGKLDWSLYHLGTIISVKQKCLDERKDQKCDQTLRARFLIIDGPTGSYDKSPALSKALKAAADAASAAGYGNPIIKKAPEKFSLRKVEEAARQAFKKVLLQRQMRTLARRYSVKIINYSESL